MAPSSVMVAQPTPLAGGNLKKQIRDTTRLLSRPTLAADLRMAQERKLKALQVALEQQAKSQVERKMADRYRMIRFFERKKALRKASQASRRMEAAKSEVEYAAALEELKMARADFFYALHFPRDRKYIALYPNGEQQEDSRVVEERRRLREEISRQVMAEAKVESIELVPLPKAEQEEEAEDLPVRTALAPKGASGGLPSDVSEEDLEDEEDDDEEESNDDDDDGEDGEDSLGSDEDDFDDDDDSEDDQDDDDDEDDDDEEDDDDDDDDEDDEEDFESEGSWDEDESGDEDQFDDEDEDEDDEEPSSKKQRKN